MSITSHSEERQLERQERFLAQMSVLNQIEAHLGGIADASKAPAIGDVLAQQTATIPASGVFEMSWPGAAFQSISVANTSAGDLTVMAGSGSPSGSPPDQGPGLFVVRAATMRTVSIQGSALTIYGTPGTVFDFTAYSRPRSPSAGSC